MPRPPWTGTGFISAPTRRFIVSGSESGLHAIPFYCIDKRIGLCAYGAMTAIAINNLIGKTALIGISKLNHRDEVLQQQQYVGVITSIGDLIHVRLSTGVDFTLPPDLSAFQPAPPGVYRLRSTGEEVENPDFTVSWTVRFPAPKKS